MRSELLGADRGDIKIGGSDGHLAIDRRQHGRRVDVGPVTLLVHKFDGGRHDGTHVSSDLIVAFSHRRRRLVDNCQGQNAEGKPRGRVNPAGPVNSSAAALAPQDRRLANIKLSC